MRTNSDGNVGVAQDVEGRLCDEASAEHKHLPVKREDDDHGSVGGVHEQARGTRRAGLAPDTREECDGIHGWMVWYGGAQSLVTRTFETPSYLGLGALAGKRDGLSSLEWKRRMMISGFQALCVGISLQ